MPRGRMASEHDQASGAGDIRRDLLREGSALHLECKSGKTGGVVKIQSRVQQFKQAFSERSRFVICCDLADTDPRIRQ